MNEKKELNFVKIEATGFQDLCNRIAELEEKNEFLNEQNLKLLKDNRAKTDEISWLKRQLQAAKFRASWATKELNEIKEMSMFEFANTYCNDSELEEAGHELARALGVGQ